MQKMASSKHASSGNGEKLLRCAGSLFTFLGLSLMAKSEAAMGHSHSSAGQCSQPCSKTPRPPLSITCGWRGAFKSAARFALPTDAPLGPMRGPPNLLRFPSAPAFPSSPLFCLKSCDCRALAGGVAGLRVSYLTVAETSLAV